MTRYALYFAPPVTSPWWQAGCSWLGRDAETGTTPGQPRVAGMPSLLMAAVTASARRYGFHATLKAPFALGDGFDEAHLLAMAAAFSRVQQTVALPALQVRRLDAFLALVPAAPIPEVNALAMRCVAFFDLLRAPPDADELARRRRAHLSVRQEALLLRWGYPHTEEAFRFHMTLTDSLAAVDDDTAYALRTAAEAHFQPLLAAGAAALPVIDGLTVFREDDAGAPLSVLARFPFGDSAAAGGLPAPGRLFYVVGPSGVGKDSLLQWLQEQVGTIAQVVFARRVITRAAHPSEAHEPIGPEAFWQEACDGNFSMLWQANGACYGIRRGIEADLLAGRDVVVNGSREYVPRIRQTFPDAQVVWISADTATIERRLVSRQRESGAALLQRVKRATEFVAPQAGDVIHIDNSGPLEVAGARLLALLQR